MTHNAHPIRGFVSSYGWVVASPLGRHGPQVRAPWHHGGHGAVDVVGPVAPPGHACGCGDAGVYTDRRKWPLRAVSGRLCTLLGCGLGLWGPWDRNSVHKWEDRASPRRFRAFGYTVGLWRRCGQAVGTQECTQIGENGLSAPFRGVCVHCCDAGRDTNCDASSARWHERPNRHGVPAAPPLGGHLSLGREGRLYASGAVARLASSPRRQPTQTPEEPIHGQAFRRSYCHSPRAQ